MHDDYEDLTDCGLSDELEQELAEGSDRARAKAHPSKRRAGASMPG